MMELRTYQRESIEAVVAGFREFSRQLLVWPTGGGKTIGFSHLAATVAATMREGAGVCKSPRTLILAHREELIDQAIEKLHRATGIFAGKEKAEFEASLNDAVVVASVQTMIRRLDKWPRDHFGLVVADEAHHAISDSWQTVLRHFDECAKVLGVTATPDRGDRRNLGEYFENVAAEVSLFDLVHQGFLSRIAVKSIPLQIDLRAVRQKAGDFHEKDLGDALAPYLGEIAKAIQAEAGFRRTLVFVPLIATSRKFVEVCRGAGINAEHIDGLSPDRAEILQRFRNGEFDLLSNAMLLTEGFDDAGIDCVTILRPTRSRSLYSQMVGRGTRVAAGKSNLLLLDFLWLHEKHALIRPAHLVAKSQEEAEQITRLTEMSGPLGTASPAGGGSEQMPLDLEGLASEAQTQREARLKEELAKKAKRKARFIDPIEFSLSLNAVEVAEYEPTMKWERAKPTEGQLGALARFGIDGDAILSAGQASKVLDLIFTRSRLNLATPKQMRYLRQFGHKRPETATFDEASRFLDGKFNKPKEAVAA